MFRNRALLGYKPEVGRPRIGLRGITRTEGWTYNPMGCCGRLYTDIASPGLMKKKVVVFIMTLYQLLMLHRV